MTTGEVLGYIAGAIGIVTFILSQRKDGRSDGAQLARIEANGIAQNTILMEVKGEIADMKKEQTVSKTFRDKYEEHIKELIVFQKEQEIFNTRTEHNDKAINEKLETLNKKFDRIMSLFNNLIEKDKSSTK